MTDSSSSNGGAGLRNKLSFWKKDNSNKSKDEGEKEKSKSSSTITQLFGCGGFARGRRNIKQEKMKMKDAPEVKVESDDAVDDDDDKEPKIVIEFPDVQLPPSPSSQRSNASIGIEETVTEERAEHAQSAWTRPPIKSANTTAGASGSGGGRARLPLSAMAANSRRASEGEDRAGAMAKNSLKPGNQSETGSAVVSGGGGGGEVENYNERDESQRMAEQRYQRKSVDMRNVQPSTAGVKIELNPLTEMWSSVVNKSLVGTGVFSKAAVCSQATGGVLACNPSTFTPSVAQVQRITDNFNRRSVFSAAGFSIADTIYSLERDGDLNKQLFMSGVNLMRTEGVFIAKCKTVLIIGAYTESRHSALNVLTELTEAFVEQGM